MRLPALRRPSPSMAVSVMALVVASTGTSYATGLIGSDDIRNNSIQSKDIKNKTIQGKDIKTGTIGAKQVKDGSLRARDFKAGQLPAGKQGPAGPAVPAAGKSRPPRGEPGRGGGLEPYPQT